MQIMERGHYPRSTGDYAVKLNPGRGVPFAQITLDERGELALNMLSVDDCDRMIKAAAAAKTLLIEHAGDKDKPHEYCAPRGDEVCLVCGKPEDEHGQHPYPETCGARPYPAGSEGDDGTECALPAGHDGPHDAEPHVRIVEAAAVPSDLIPSGAPSSCGAKIAAPAGRTPTRSAPTGGAGVRSASPTRADWVNDFGEPLYCWRKDGHEGAHYDQVDKLHWLDPEVTR
jgi:hypothetical protein